MKKTFDIVAKRLHTCFSMLFLFSFSFILLNIIFNKSIYNYNTINLLLPAAFFIILFVFLARLIIKRESFFEKHYTKILIAFAFIMLSVQLCFVPYLKFNSSYDFEAIYRGAIQLAEYDNLTNYTSQTCHPDYFYIFPNNLGATAFLSLFFRLARLLGVTDYFIVGSVINSILSVLSMVLASLICRRLFKAAGGIFVLLFFLASPPFYLIAAVFYTDSLSMFFPLAAFYLLLKSSDCKNIISKISCYTSGAILLSIGALIKMTVIIFPIAAVIYFLLKRYFKNLLLYSFITATVISLSFAVFNGYIYSKHLDRELAEQKNQPIYYWLDTAFHNNGEYNNDIYWTSSEIADPEQRKEYLKRDLFAQIKELKLHGIYKLFETKSARAFGDGTYALSDFLDDEPINPGKIQEAILYEGKNYKKYSCYATSVFIAIQLLMLLSVSLKKPEFKLLIPKLCVFGIMFFLLFWEVNSRYITTFIPFIFIVSAGGLYSFSKNIKFSK